MRRFLLASAFLIGSIAAARAQSPSVGMVQISPGIYEPLGPSNALSVNTVQVPVTGNSTTSNGTASLPAVAGKTNYVCGFEYEASVTAAVFGNTTLSGILGGSMVFYTFVPASSTGSGKKAQNFFPCLPASATNTAITLTTPAIGAGGVANFNIWGYVR